MKQGDPLGSPLFALAHYWTLLKTIAWTPIYVFPSLVDDTHIVCLLNEIISTFDHLWTQLALIGLNVKVSKCKFWSPSGIYSCIEILQGYFGHRWLTHFGCANEFSRFCHAFFRWGFISKWGAYRHFSSFGKHPGCFGFFVFMCHSSIFLSHSDSTSFFFTISYGRF